MKQRMMALLLVLSLVACGSAKTSTPSSEADKPQQESEKVTSTEPKQEETSASADVIRLGMYMPLTGNSSTLGNGSYEAAQLAVKRINDAGGLLGKQVELICYDDQSSTEQAVKNVTRLIQEDQVQGLIGSLHSGNIKATGDIVEQAAIPEIGTGIAVDWLQQGWTYLFRSLANTNCICITIPNMVLLATCLEPASDHLHMFPDRL